MSRKKKIALLITLFCLIAALCLKYGVSEDSLKNVAEQGGDYKGVLTFDGLKRSYLVHVPLGIEKADGSVPLILVLHGAGGNAKSAARMSQMNDVSDKQGFIAVYPSGTGIFREYLLSWNAGGCCNFVEPFDVDDVGFIGALIDKLRRDHGIDSNKIYAAGVSNGGMMAHRLGCELADTLAGIAAVSSSVFVEECEPSDFLSVIIFHNLDDRVIPFDGGESSDLFIRFFKLKFKSEREAVSFWSINNFCQKSPLKEHKETFYRELYSDCKDNTEVALYAISEGDHSWPGGEKGWFLGSKPTKNVFASEIIWDFFKKHSKI